MFLKNFCKKSEINLRDEIWILSDNRPGTFSQAVGLAEKIGLEYQSVNLDYNIFAKLPNFILGKFPIHLKNKSKIALKNSDIFPRIVISAGRRSATAALYIKKISQKKTTAIQIMNPDLDFKKFDLVILPKHDGLSDNKSKNLITTIGSLTKIDDKIIATESEKFTSWFSEITKIKIAILIGGSSTKTIFDQKSAEKLAKSANKIAKNMNAKLLIMNSRRTEDQITNSILQNLDCDFDFFDWKSHQTENPYLAILGYADFFIVSGDSVSMISECCSSGKPVFIFDSGEISSAKHRKFHQELIANKYAKRLEINQEFLQNFFPQKLQETKRIASFVRQNILID